MFLCAFAAIASSVWNTDSTDHAWYLAMQNEEDQVIFCVSLCATLGTITARLHAYTLCGQPYTLESFITFFILVPPADCGLARV